MQDKKNFGFSVIIPTRNEEDYIEECINSLLDSFERSYIDSTEFIIVDGMSTDRTVDIVKEKFSHLNLKILENPNLYQSYAMNIGIENSDDSAEFSLIIRAVQGPNNPLHSAYPTYIEVAPYDQRQRNLQPTSGISNQERYDQLERLDALKDKGIITEEEFEKEKDRIL